MSDLDGLVCGRCGRNGLETLGWSLQHELICHRCLGDLEAPRIKQRVTDSMENHSIRLLRSALKR
jgi:hypothetical protein